MLISFIRGLRHFSIILIMSMRKLTYLRSLRKQTITRLGNVLYPMALYYDLRIPSCDLRTTGRVIDIYLPIAVVWNSGFSRNLASLLYKDRCEVGSDISTCRE